MRETKLSKSERRELKKLQRPSIILSIGLLLIITGVNLVIHFHDVVTGIEGLARPPISQLIIIEVVALLLAFISFYYLSKKSILDLANNTKQNEQFVITHRYMKNNAGIADYLLKLKGAFEVSVDLQIYKNVKVGDLVEVSFAPESHHVFEVKRTT